MSPEYVVYGQFSEKSDVFSFGVLVLEILTGERNSDFFMTEVSVSLLGWVRHSAHFETLSKFVFFQYFFHLWGNSFDLLGME